LILVRKLLESRLVEEWCPSSTLHPSPFADQRDLALSTFQRTDGARKERAPVIAIAGDVETMVTDTFSLQEMNPYHFFQAASL
jgi:hypothetical protein